MVDMKQLLTNIVREIVEFPDDVMVTQTESGDTIHLQLTVAESDMGKVIGRHGKIARSLRLVMKSAANTIGKRVTVDID